MIQGSRGVDGAENPLTMRDVASSLEELGTSVYAQIPDGWLDAVCDDRGQTGTDADHVGGLTTIPLYTDAAERAWAACWLAETSGRKSSIIVDVRQRRGPR